MKNFDWKFVQQLHELLQRLDTKNSLRNFFTGNALATVYPVTLPVTLGRLNPAHNTYPFVNGLSLIKYCVFLCARSCVCVCVYGQSDRCWTAIVMDFNAYWAALPSGGWHGLLKCKCKVCVCVWRGGEGAGMAGKCSRGMELHCMTRVGGGRSVTGVHSGTKV